MNYDSLFRSQLDRLDLSGMESILGSPLIPDELTENVSIKEILLNMLTGKELISWENVFYILKTLAFGELHNVMAVISAAYYHMHHNRAAVGSIFKFREKYSFGYSRAYKQLHGCRSFALQRFTRYMKCAQMQ